MQNGTLISDFPQPPRIPLRQSRGLSLDIALTSRCPLSCRYCTVEKTPTRELDSARWVRIIRGIAALRPIAAISLEGGEPLLREDLAPILASALDHARQVKVVTGGAVPHGLPDSLVSSPRFSFEVSLDGPAPVHNYLRDRSYDQAYGFLRDCLRRGIRVRFRTVISRHNLPFYESGLEDLDRSLAPEKTGFFFDTIIPPRALSGQGGPLRRASLRDFPAGALVPAPLEILALFKRLRARTFRSLVFLQDEPIRGCGAVESPCLSFDPAGIYTCCCESPNGLGSAADEDPEACLALMDRSFQDLPCRACPSYGPEICLGCWTGQKCGMVGHFGFAHCRELAKALGGERLRPPSLTRTPGAPLG